jgi:citronellol/citronellal dehydrogenase
MADAAVEILRMGPQVTGEFFLDEEVLREAGVEDFTSYQLDPGLEPRLDLFVRPDANEISSLT